MLEFCHSDIILSYERLVPDSRVYAIVTFFSLNSKGIKNLNFSPEGPTTFKIFRFETLFIADY